MKPQLKVLVGISGSKKSTWATEFISDNERWVRVNRDDARRQVLGKLTGDYYSSSRFGKTEKHVTNIIDEQIRYWLNAGMNVIVDNTHLTVKYLRHYNHLFGHLANISFKLFDEPVKDCQDRVLSREGPGTSVDYIQKQYDTLHKSDPRVMIDTVTKEIEQVHIRVKNLSNRKCIIVDIDGTVADCTGIRDPYDGKKLHLDNVIKPVRLLLKRFHGNWFTRLTSPVTIIYLSGREDKWKDATVKWIKQHKLPYDGLIYMRQTGDMRTDSIIKEELFTAHIERDYNTQFVLDDRISVCHHWYKLGLFVMNVNQGLKHF